MKFSHIKKQSNSELTNDSLVFASASRNRLRSCVGVNPLISALSPSLLQRLGSVSRPWELTYSGHLGGG